MNLRDLERMTEAVFGSCPGCDACDACRAQGLVKMAWETGRRSGSASAADRSVKYVRWDEWDWTTAQLELVEYVKELACYDAISPALREFVAEEITSASEWARSKAARRADWTAFMKSWFRRRETDRIPLNPQGDLFAGSSLTSSVASGSQDRRKQARSAAAMRLLKGGKH